MNNTQKGRINSYIILLVCIVLATAVAYAIGWVYPLIKGALVKPSQLPAPPRQSEELLGINTFGMYIAEPVIRAVDGNLYRFEKSWLLESEPGEIVNTPCQQNIVRRFESLAGSLVTCLEAGQAGEFSTPPTSYYALATDGEIWTMEIEEPQFLLKICLLGLFIPIGLFVGLAIISARRRTAKNELSQTDQAGTNPSG